MSRASWNFSWLFSLHCLLSAHASAQAQPPAPLNPVWQTVVNNGDPVPADPCSRTFNSYNQPSVNAMAMVVFRGRSRGGDVCGEGAHGIYSRQMPGGSLVRVFDRISKVPYPNNLNGSFIEPPSFPRIDIWTNALASRAIHAPIWEYPLPDGTVTRAGTTGLYAVPQGGTLLTGASKLGASAGFPVFGVPGAIANTVFDVFPGAPAIMDGTVIAFKGNYTENGVARTGTYFRRLETAPGGGASAVQLIGNSKDTKIPGTNLVFGSLAPPSAAAGQIVVAGFDNEANPSAGGIYHVSSLSAIPNLRPLVTIGSQVPGEPFGERFAFIGEGLSFDGGSVAFWAAWGAERRTLRLDCPVDGNADRVAYCLSLYPNGYYVSVPVKQGIFVHQVRTGVTSVVAKAGSVYGDFLFWNFSGRVPGTGEGDDDGELARWRSAAFAAVWSGGGISRTVFKALTTSGYAGIYGFDSSTGSAYTVLDTSMDGQRVDPEAPLGSKVIAVGIERDGFRNGILALTASMAIPGAIGEETGWAGVYVTALPGTECAYSLNFANRRQPFSGGGSTGSLVTGAECLWNGTTDAAWITLSSNTGPGTTAISYVAGANPGRARMGKILAATQAAVIVQDGNPAVGVFTDVPSTSPYFDYISLLNTAGITAGCSVNPPLYCPDTPATRAQMAVFIVAAFAKVRALPPPNPVPYFNDVPATSPYFPFVQSIKELGITAGCSANPPLFCPNDTITHGQMAVFMIASWMKANNLTSFTYSPVPYFTDVPATHPFFRFVQKMRDLGFRTGCSATQYCPDSNVTRADMAPLILRAILGAP